MVRTQIQLKESQVEALRKIAAVQRVSIAELIRRAVDMVAGSAEVTDMAERRRRAMAAVGRFRSGKKDLSSRHDEYLVEAFDR